MDTPPDRIVQAPSRTMVSLVGAGLAIAALGSFGFAFLSAVPNLGGSDAPETVAAPPAPKPAPKPLAPVAEAPAPVDPTAEAKKLADADAAVKAAKKAEADAKARADRLAREAREREDAAAPSTSAPSNAPTPLAPQAPPETAPQTPDPLGEAPPPF